MKGLLKRKVVQDGIWYTLANVVTQLSSLIGVLFVSRYLGPTNLGIYSFLQNYIAAFVTVFSGIDIYANWRIVKSPDWYSELQHYIRQKIAVTVPVLIVLCTVSYTYLPVDIARLIPILCIPIVTNILASSVFVLQYNNKSRLIATGMIFSCLIILLAKIIAVLTQQPFQTFVAINSIDGLLLILISSYYIFFNRKYKTSTEKKPLEIIKLLKNSRFSIIYVVFWYIVVRADQFFVPAYFDTYSLGIYSSAVKVIEMTNVLIVILQSIVLPRMTFIQAETATTKRMHITLGLYITVGLVAVLGIQIFAPLVVSILFGPAFTETVNVLRVYAWSIPGLFVSYLFSVVAMSNNTIKVLSIHSLVIAVCTVAALTFASSFGSIYAIAWVSTGAYSVSALTLYVLWSRKYI